MIQKYLIFAALMGGFLIGAYFLGRTHENAQWELKTTKSQNKAMEADVEIEKQQKKVFVPRDAKSVRECLRKSCA